MKEGRTQGLDEASNAFTLHSEQLPNFLARNRCR